MAPARKKVKRYPGVYTRESSKRRHNNAPDVCFYFVVKVDEGGKQKMREIKVGWRSEGYDAQDAARLRGEFIQKARHGSASPQAGKKELTFGEAFDLYYENHAKPNKKSHESDLSRYNFHLKDRIGHKKLSKITQEDVLDIIRDLTPPKDKREQRRIQAEWKAKGEKGKPWYSGSLSRQVVQLIGYVYKKMLEWPNRSNYFGDNPASKVKLPKPSPSRQRHLTQDDARALLEDIRKRSEKTYSMCVMSLETGMRIGEVFNMRWQDVDLANGVVNLPDSKGGRANEKVFLSRRCIEVLEAMPDKDPAKLVFPNSKGKVIVQMSDAFDHAVKALGLNDGITDNSNRVVPHTLRHTYASWLAMSGQVDVYQLKDIMRHRSIQMTMKYAHLLPEHGGRKGAEIINGIMG